MGQESIRRGLSGARSNTGVLGRPLGSPASIGGIGMLMHAASRVLLALMWLLHWLPLPVLAVLGRGLGALVWWGVRSRRAGGAAQPRAVPARAEPSRRAKRIAREHFALARPQPCSSAAAVVRDAARG